jgi:hypothetical protein
VKIEAAHVQMLSVHRFTSLWTSMKRYLAVEPCLSPSDGPLVLDSCSKPRFAAMPRMEVYNAKLLILLEAIDNNLLRLVMQLITFREPITAGHPTEAQHCPEIF